MGHDIAHTPMARANKMGKQIMDGILIQQSGDDPIGEDIVLDNYTDFRSDMLITLKDVWTFQHLPKLALNWTPLCVAGDTLVNFDSGKVSSLNADFRLTNTPVQYWMKKPLLYPLYSIRTVDGDELSITGNSYVAVVDRSIVKWRRVETLKSGELVITNYEQSGKPISTIPWAYDDESQLANLDSGGNQILRRELPCNDGSGYSKKALSLQNLSLNRQESYGAWIIQNRSLQIFKFHRLATEYDRNRISLFGRHSGRRRQSFSINHSKEASEWVNPFCGDARTNDYEYRRLSDRLGSNKNKDVGRLSIKFPFNQTMSQFNNVGVQDIPDFERNLPLPYSEEEEMSTIDTVYRDADEKTVPFSTRRGNNSANREHSQFAEFQTAEIQRLRRVVTKEAVYDLTTGTHNYFANNILIHNCPVDHSPISDAIVHRLNTTFKVITISRFGQAELRKRRVDSVYIPHGVRTDLFKPLTPEEKLAARELFGLPKDAYVVGILAMNRARKQIPRMMRGIKRFKELYPEVPIHVMLWTNLSPSRSEEVTMGVADVGVNLVPELFQLGLGDIIHFPNWRDVEKMGGLPDYHPIGKDLRKLIGCWDVNFLCSGGEGAGLTYLEAASLHVPSIGTNYAGAPEYIGCGLTVPWHDYDVINTPGVRYALPDIDGMAEALRKIYDGDKEKMARRLRRHADSYDYEIVMSAYWEPFLSDCARELYPLITKDGTRSWA